MNIDDITIGSLCLDHGSELWDKAQRLIPGGNMLLTKNKNLYSPGMWPCYYSKAKGSKVWDLDGNMYTDFTTNGVGCCTLGHSCDEVDHAVIKAVQSGVMSSLNCPAEVELADRLLSLNQWAGMVKFARTGGEANAIAIRIARAFSKRDKVAVCGYHGWHDWYISCNLENSSNLNQHLLKGINPGGVPKILSGYTIPITYNNFDQLEKLNNNDIGVLKMEVERTCPPSPGYLEAIRKICDEKGIILIFDECTSGFRQEFGGLFLHYQIEPDMCVFGKALGNGYAITAVLGRSDIMKSALDSFISSTFWTESIGPTAALATLDKMEETLSWKQLPLIGNRVKEIWRTAARLNNINIEIAGIDAIPTFSFMTESPQSIKTIFTEFMLKRRFLASTQFYPTICHSDADLDDYKASVNDAFKYISFLLKDKVDLTSYCHTFPSEPSFRRMN